MSQLEALMESEETQTFLETNQELIMEAESSVTRLPQVLKKFVLTHPEEFIAENLEETKKNIRVFTEIATQQYITEITTAYGSELEEDSEVNASVSDYI